jgi:small multidrug resistance family-3 protein
VLFLLIAAVLEAGGDALMRGGRNASTLLVRVALFVCGGAALFAYGYLVNRPGWEFGRSLGLYVVLFFIVTQLISWLVFHQPPGRGVLIGGVFIAVGGVLVYTVK